MPDHTMLLRQGAHIAPTGTAAHTHKNARNKGIGDGVCIVCAGGADIRLMCATQTK